MQPEFPNNSRVKFNLKNFISGLFLRFQVLPIIVVMIIFIIVLSVLSDSFLTIENMFNIARQISMIFITAAGMTMLLVSGGVDISVGSMLAVTGVISSAAAVYWGINPFIAIIIGIIVGALLGGFNSFFIVKGKIAPIIVTLATMSIFRSIPFLLTEANPVFGLPDFYKYIGQGYLWKIPFPVILMIIIFIITYFVLTKTTFGLRLYVIGGNEKAARLSGINVNLYKYVTYIITGVFAGLSGVMLTARLGSGISTAGQGFEFDVLTAVLIGGVSLNGGKGSIIGAMVGCLIMGILSNGLNLLNVSAYYQMLLKGAMLLFAVLLDSLARKSENT